MAPQKCGHGEPTGQCALCKQEQVQAAQRQAPKARPRRGEDSNKSRAARRLRGQ